MAIDVMVSLATNVELAAEKVWSSTHETPVLLLKQVEALATWCDQLIRLGHKEDHSDLTWPWSGRNSDRIKYCVAQITSPMPLYAADTIKYGVYLAGMIYLETHNNLHP